MRLKLNCVQSEFRGKNVLLVDDSIVRGTTSCEIIQMARAAGAKRVWFASAAPPVRYPNVYGIDIPNPEELVAHDRTEDEIAVYIGADKVIYNDLEEVEDAVRQCERLSGSEEFKQFDGSCFNGVYVTNDIDAEYLAKLGGARGQGRKAAAIVDSPEPASKKTKL